MRRAALFGPLPRPQESVSAQGGHPCAIHDIHDIHDIQLLLLLEDDLLPSARLLAKFLRCLGTIDSFFHPSASLYIHVGI